MDQRLGSKRFQEQVKKNCGKWAVIFHKVPEGGILNIGGLLIVFSVVGVHTGVRIERH
jgi:hypothetical protein